MIPSLLLEEPPARTSAKEPWVSDGVQSGCRGCKAAGEAGEGRSAASLPPQAAWRFPFPEASWNFSFHGSPTLRHAIAQMCTEASCVPCTGLVVEVTKMLPLEALGVSARPSPPPRSLHLWARETVQLWAEGQVGGRQANGSTETPVSLGFRNRG